MPGKRTNARQQLALEKLRTPTWDLVDSLLDDGDDMEAVNITRKLILEPANLRGAHAARTLLRLKPIIERLGISDDPRQT